MKCHAPPAVAANNEKKMAKIFMRKYCIKITLHRFHSIFFHLYFYHPKKIVRFTSNEGEEGKKWKNRENWASRNLQYSVGAVPEHKSIDVIRLRS